MPANGFLQLRAFTSKAQFPLGDVAMKTKFVPEDSKMVITARDIGISFGD